MLNKWKLCNFKSVRVDTELELAPLTIFAGANSSGKSTFLQSMLLVAQTLAHKVSSRSVVLNGSFAKLGQFDDLKSVNSKTDQIQIGWTCTPPHDGQEGLGGGFRPRPFFTSRGKERLVEVSGEVFFDANDSEVQSEIAQIQPLLYASRLSATTTDPEIGDRKYSVDIRRAKNSGAEKQYLLNPTEDNDPIAVRSLRFDISLDEHSITEFREDLVSAQAVGCLLRHFLPERITLAVDMVTEDARAIVNSLTGDSPRETQRRYIYERDIPIPEEVVESVLDAAEQIQDAENQEIRLRIETELNRNPNLYSPEPIFLEQIHKALRSLNPKHRLEIRRVLSDRKDFADAVLNSIRTSRQQQLEVISYRPPRGIAGACWYTDQFFSSFLKYLGPLRDEPKSLYPLSPTADPSDVGLKGEHTAAVLELHKNRPIRYIPTSAFANADVKPEPTTRPLEAAVVDWLQYLGVAEGVESKDKGKFGHELTVQIAGTNRHHDLTHVGVGVSQVLPILVASLLSDTDTTLVFEQPELHLHPKVQTLLADFFLSITQLGKQCIIETHSEYLINRIRYRTAAAVDHNPWVEAVKLYFVDRDNNSSSFRSVDINEYGAIIDWPEGFFDQSQIEAEAILRAASLKRKSRRDE